MTWVPYKVKRVTIPKVWDPTLSQLLVLFIGQVFECLGNGRLSCLLALGPSFYLMTANKESVPRKSFCTVMGPNRSLVILPGTSAWPC